MPSLAEPFDGVLTEKDWSKARDKTGLTGSLTEKVSMGKELTLFHKTKDEAAASHLLGKISTYEQVLKAKHSKDKYYAKLLKLVTEQKEAVQLGINVLKNVPVIADVRKRLQKISSSGGDRIADYTQTKAAEKAFRERFEALTARVRDLRKEVPEGAFILNPTTVEAVVHLEKDFEKFQADLEIERKSGEDDDDDDGGEEAGEGVVKAGATTSAAKHWEKVMVPYVTGLINSVLSKHPDLILKVSPTQLIGGLMGAVRARFEQTFDPAKIRPFGKDHRPEPHDTTTTEAVNSAATLLLQAAQSATSKKADTEWFQYAPLEEKTKTGNGGKKVEITGAGPEQFDDQKAYGTLLMKLSGLKSDAGAAAKFLSDGKLLSAIFPYEMSDGRKETDPNQKKPSVLTNLAALGSTLSDGVTNVRKSLGQQPPDIEAARATLGQLEQDVNRLQLPRHGDTVQKGVKLFILKPLEDEITAKVGK